MKTLGKIFVFLVFAAVVSMIYYWQVVHQPLADIPQKKQESNELVYTNDKYLFEVKYDKRYLLREDSDSPHYFKTGGGALATISIPNSLYEKTNFGSADITFAVKPKSTLADCQTYVNSANSAKKMTENFSLNEITYYTAELDGAAAGTHYRTKLYRTWRDPSCLEISMTVGIANIGNYDPAMATKEVTFDEIFPKLEAVAHSLTFLPAESAETLVTGAISGHFTAPTPDAYDMTQLVVYSQDRSKIVKKEQLDQTGNYYIELPVGIYYVTYTSIYNNFQPPMKKVTIAEDVTTKLDFTIGQ